MKRLKLIPLMMVIITLLAACGSGQDDNSAQEGASTVEEGVVLVEIISLDHSPIRPAVQDVEAVAAEFGDKVVVQAINFGTPEGDALAAERELTEHTPIAIFVNGEMEFEVNGRSVKFYSFPQGEGTGIVAEGVWTMEDLRTVLEQATD